MLANADDAKLLKRVRRTRTVPVDYRADMQRLCQKIGAPIPVTEYTFYDQRKWRFDFAFFYNVAGGVAVEVDGGILRGGRHTSSVSGRLRDMEKLNTAASLGWLVLTASTLPRRILDKSKHELPWLSLQDPEFATILRRALLYKGFVLKET